MCLCGCHIAAHWPGQSQPGFYRPADHPMAGPFTTMARGPEDRVPYDFQMYQRALARKAAEDAEREAAERAEGSR